MSVHIFCPESMHIRKKCCIFAAKLDMLITLFIQSRTATYGDRSAKLTHLEFALLQHLIRNADRICTRDEIIDAVWGVRFHYDTGTIDVHLNAIRRKLGLLHNYPIETFRGVGLCYHSDHEVQKYTFNLRKFVIDWLQSHEAELTGKCLVPQLHLDPFVSEVREHPNTYRHMMDAILAMLLPTAQPGYIRVSTTLGVSHFSFKIEINGTSNELKIPLICR